MDAASEHNIYSSSPVTPSTVSKVDVTDRLTIPAVLGSAAVPATATDPAKPAVPPKAAVTRGAHVTGALVIAPGSTGGPTPETATFTGTLDFPADTTQNLPEEQYAMSLTGFSAPVAANGSDQTFYASGSITFNDKGAKPVLLPPSLGYTASVVFNGVRKVEGSGVETFTGFVQPSSANAATATSYPTFTLKPAAHGAAPLLAKSSSASSASGGGSGSSFGTIVTFTLVYGLNGGPTWTLVHFKGPSSPLANIGRTNTDSLTISFTPACRDDQGGTVSFWDTIPLCSDLPTQTAAAAVNNGVNINSLLLRNFVIRQ